MKQLVGSDIGSYVFSSSAGTIDFRNIDYNLSVKNILGIVNCTSSSVLFNPIKLGYGGSISENVLTLEASTSLYSDSDELQIWIDIPESRIFMAIVSVLRDFKQVLAPLAGIVDRSTNRARMSTIVESGTVTTVTMVTTASTVAGVSINNNIGFLVSNNAWNNSVRRRFT